jgi:GT2 family glycosyltransferase
MASIAAVVLNWNQPQLTVRAARSLLSALGECPGEVIVVDNGSVDDSLTVFAREVPTALVVANEANLGFARGMNRGVEAALVRDHDVVLVVNNDAEVDRHAISRIMRVLEHHNDIGVLGGKILTEDGRLWFAGNSFSRFTAGPTAHGHLQPDEGQWDLARDVEGVTLAFAAIPRATFDTVGLFCEDYFFGQEEWDFSTSVRRAGLRCRYEPSILAVHEGDGSHANADPRFVYHGYRNKITYQNRMLPAWAFWPWMVVFFAYALVQRADPGQGRRGALIGDRSYRRRCAVGAIRDFFRYGRRIEMSHAEAFATRCGLAQPAM